MGGATRQASSLTRSLARWISILGHPFVLIPVSIFIATTGTSASSRGLLLAIVGASFALLAFYVVRRRNRGEITNVDISTREDRPGAYRLAIISLAATALVLHLTHQNPTAVRGAASATGLFVAGSIVNRRIKASLHCAFAMLAAGIIWPTSHAIGAAFAGATLVIAWARVTYECHTLGEVIAGTLLGATFAAIYVALVT